MKATKIRNVKGEKVSSAELETLCSYIVAKAAKAGFITGSSVEGATSVKIGLHMRSFSIDTEKLGHNARIGRFIESPKGYKRTDVPTWTQREDFNHLVNAAFDRFELKARIVSGNYTVRDFDTGAVRNWYEGGDLGSNGFSAHASVEITTEREAREDLDSDRLEAEHKEKMKAERAEKSKAYRAHAKAVRAAKFLALKVSSWGAKGYETGVKVITLKELQKLNAKKTYRLYKLTDVKPLEGKTRAEAEMNLKIQGAKLSLVGG